LRIVVFLTVLHRLFDPGSDRAADKWRTDYQIDGCESLQLHHLYRTMAWLGEALPQDQQTGKTPFAPRCTKDRIEEELFAHRRDLFTGLQQFPAWGFPSDRSLVFISSFVNPSGIIPP
jgi:hypothetical protein